MTILDKLGTMTKGLTDSAKLTFKIGEEKRKLPDLYEKLGRLVYTRFANGEATDAAYIEFCDAIANVQNNIRLLNEQLAVSRAAAENRHICPACGQDIDEGSGFCIFCGTKLTPDEPPKEPGIICPDCGSEMVKHARFCSVCGAALPVSEGCGDECCCGCKDGEACSSEDADA